MRAIAILMAAIAALCGHAGQARAGVVTFETETEAGPAVLTFDYDEAALEERLRYRENAVDLADILDIELIVGGETYALSGPLAGDVVFDRKAGTLTYIASDAALDAGAPAFEITLFFGGRVNIRHFSELVDVMFAMSPEEVEILLTRAAVPVPLPAAAWLFAGGIGLCAAGRRQRLATAVPA